MNCTTSEILIQRSFDAPLPAIDGERLAAHLATCPACRAMQAELGSLLNGMGKWPEVEAPADFGARVMNRIASLPPEPMEKPGDFLVAIYVSMGAAALLLIAGVLLGDAGLLDLVWQSTSAFLGLLGHAWNFQLLYQLLSGLLSRELFALFDAAQAAAATVVLAALVLLLRHFRTAIPPYQKAHR